MEEMFCFQCQQTAHNTGCEGNAGVCGKKSDTANFQDELTGALIGLSRAVHCAGATKLSDELMMKGLFTTITNVNFYNKTVNELTAQIRAEKDKIAKGTEDYDVQKIWEDNEDIRSLKSLILFGLRGMAAYAYHAFVLGFTDKAVTSFFYEGMYAIGEDYSMEQLLPIVLKTGEANYKCME
ncbi:MAG: hydroxylamine reductase, partial [Oscillospiraceae bacterium]|nr:hydroxylamine reductase [Oscillospiraceae bacterium]